MWSNTHNIKFTVFAILKCIFSVKYIHIVAQLIARTFSSCKTETLYPLKSNSPVPGNHHATFCLHEFDSSGSSHKWNYAMFVFLWLAYFTWQNGFKVCTCCSICQNYVIIPHFVYPFIHRWTLGFLLSWLLWIMLLWTWVYKYLFEFLLCQSFRYIPRSVWIRW